MLSVLFLCRDMSHNDLCGTIPVSGSFSHLQAKRYDFETEAYHSENIAFKGSWFCCDHGFVELFHMKCFVLQWRTNVCLTYRLMKVLLVCVCV